jgi:hypothetical protein
MSKYSSRPKARPRNKDAESQHATRSIANFFSPAHQKDQRKSQEGTKRKRENPDELKTAGSSSCRSTDVKRLDGTSKNDPNADALDDSDCVVVIDDDENDILPTSCSHANGGEAKLVWENSITTDVSDCASEHGVGNKKVSGKKIEHTETMRCWLSGRIPRSSSTEFVPETRVKTRNETCMEIIEVASYSQMKGTCTEAIISPKPASPHGPLCRKSASSSGTYGNFGALVTSRGQTARVGWWCRSFSSLGYRNALPQSRRTPGVGIYRMAWGKRVTLGLASFNANMFGGGRSNVEAVAVPTPQAGAAPAPQDAYVQMLVLMHNEVADTTVLGMALDTSDRKVLRKIQSASLRARRLLAVLKHACHPVCGDMSYAACRYLKPSRGQHSRLCVCVYVYACVNTCE